MFVRIKPVVKKEFIHIARDRRTLILTLFLPAFLLIMYGYALNFDVKHIALAVYDQEKSRASRDFSEKFMNSEYFNLKYYLSSMNEIDRLMDERKFRVALVIPRDFSKNLMQGKESTVQVLVAGEDALSASTAIGYVNAIAQSYTNQVLIEMMMRAGRQTLSLPIDFRPRVWYNPELRSSKFLVPGLMAFILMIILVITTSFAVVREKERGTMEQIIVSPLKPVELLLGKTIPYVFICLISAHLVLLFGYVLFGVAIKGNYLLLLLGMLLFLSGGLGLGLLISTFAHTQQVAFMMAALTTALPTIVLSGFIFPIRNMPIPIQAITYFIPARYFLTILRCIVLKDVGITAFWSQLLFLAGFAVLVISLSSLRMKATRTRG